MDALQRLRSSRLIWPVVIIVSTIGLDALVFGEVVSPLRPPLAIWFISVCPGLALVRLLRLEDGWSEMAVSLALSITLGVMVATGLVYADWWSAKAGLAILSAVSLGGAVLQLATAPAAWPLTRRTAAVTPESRPST
jgi:hypothetical protein